jgi:HEPN domain-containing protein
MSNRSADWFKQAERDLEQARDSMNALRHEWACFASHQGAEKALKALHLYFNQEAWGHVAHTLIEELPDSIRIPDELIGKARALDAYNIPTQYVNGHPEGAPFEHYGKIQSVEAIKYAGEILEFCRSQMA